MRGLSMRGYADMAALTRDTMQPSLSELLSGSMWLEHMESPCADLPVEAHQHGHGVLSHGVRRVGGHARNSDAGFCACAQVHPVVARTSHGHKPAVRNIS